MTKVNFDIVHNTQTIYRKLLDCMARPGKVENIFDVTKSLDNESRISPMLEALALTLIDREVSYAFLPNLDTAGKRYIQWKTFSVEQSISEADYIFIQGLLPDEEISQVMKQVKRGTLADPHVSATLIICVKEISKMAEVGRKLSLEGPGIKDKTTIHVAGLSATWINERKEVNKEFPIGVDMIFVTEMGDMIAIPRTTRIESE